MVAVPLVAFNDAWPRHTERWQDIGDKVYTSAFRTGFSSTSSGSIYVAYQPNAAGGVLTTKVWAQGLKPNFCYQIKLVGKPGVNGTGGLWGSLGEADMAGNTKIMLSGRYWDYGTETEHFSTTDRAWVSQQPYYQQGWTAGYMLLGCFATDGNGNTPGWIDLDGDDGVQASHGSYHVVWKGGQSIPAGSVGFYPCAVKRFGLTWPVDPYASNVRPSFCKILLYCEREPGVAQPYQLASGSYDAVLMLTEESFHSPEGSTGGFWATVRVSDWSTVPSPISGAPWISRRGTRVQFTVP